MNPLRLIIPIALIIIFFVYIIYLIGTNKESKKIKAVLFPGLFFIAVWIVIYFLMMN